MSDFAMRSSTPVRLDPADLKGANDRASVIVAQIPRVQWIAARIHHRLPPVVALEDLVSIGVLGLIAAVDNYDPSYNVKLETYADHRIRGAILDSIRGLDGVPAHKRARAKELERARNSVEQRTQQNASSQDVAEELGISIDDYHVLAVDSRHVNFRSLEAEADKDRTTMSLVEVIADGVESQPYHLMEQAELERLIQKGLQALPPMERKVMTLYFKEGLCLREIADQVHLHITRISQLKTRATERLRSFMRVRWVAEKGGERARNFRSTRPEPVLAD